METDAGRDEIEGETSASAHARLEGDRIGVGHVVPDQEETVCRPVDEAFASENRGKLRVGGQERYALAGHLEIIERS